MTFDAAFWGVSAAGLAIALTTLAFCYNISIALKAIADEAKKQTNEQSASNQVVHQFLMESSRDHIRVVENQKVVIESLRTVMRQNEKILDKLK